MNNSYEFKWRIMELWSEPGGGVLFSNSKSILQTREMLELGTASSAYGLAKFIDYIKSLGFNTLSHYGNPDNYKDAMYNFSSYLKEKNIGHICRRYWNEYRRGYSWPPDFNTVREPVISEKHCPFNPEVKKFWQERIEKDMEMMPGLAGYVIAGSEYYCIQGAPWNCNCEKCQKLTRRERLIAALELMGDLLKKYNKTLFGEAALELYLDWKLGTLTIEKIDKKLEKCKGLKGILLDEPLKRSPKPVSFVSFDPASLLTFAEDLKSELREPKLKEFLEINKDNY
ncbi:MAG: hypothetical protein M1308_06560 [Actinobacteria bacterium]|nr:hypothetical protein [Actinomycetota bacterium]